MQLAKPEYDLPPKDSNGWFARPRRYHHGDLFNSAIRRGLEIVQQQGPEALTLRGLARDLNVTAPALCHHFGSRAGLRSAVAAWVGRDLRELGQPPGPRSRPLERIRDTAKGWMDLAGRAPNLYRAAFGEGWLPATSPGQGWYSLYFGYRPPTDTLRRQSRPMLEHGERLGVVRPRKGYAPRGIGTLTRTEHEVGFPSTPEARERAEDVACCIAAALHGLGFARVEGVAADRVERALDVLLDALAAPRVPAG